MICIRTKLVVFSCKTFATEGSTESQKHYSDGWPYESQHSKTVSPHPRARFEEEFQDPEMAGHAPVCRDGHIGGIHRVWRLQDHPRSVSRTRIDSPNPNKRLACSNSTFRDPSGLTR